MRAALLLVAACGSSSTSPPSAVAPAAPAGPVGRLETSTELVGNTEEIRAAGTQVPLAQLRPYLGASWLPMSGLADIDVAIDVPNASATLITGHARVHCTKCRIGDDVAKLAMPTKNARSSAFAGDGFEFGHIDLDSVDIAVAIENGRAEIRTWKVASPQLALEVTGHVDLATSVERSRVEGCIRFKLSESLQKDQPKTAAVLSLTGAPLGDDGFYSIRLEGTVGELRRLGQACH